MYKRLGNIHKKFKGRWNTETCPKGDELKDNEAYFVYKVVYLFSHYITGNELIRTDITDEQMTKYINSGIISCEESNSPGDVLLWGNSNDIHLLALLHECNIYILRECCTMLYIK